MGASAVWKTEQFSPFPQFSCELQAGDTNLPQTLLYSVYFPGTVFFLVDDNNVDLYVAADPGALSCFPFSDSGQKCSSVGDNVSLVTPLSDLMSQHVG